MANRVRIEITLTASYHPGDASVNPDYHGQHIVETHYADELEYWSYDRDLDGNISGLKFVYKWDGGRRVVHYPTSSIVKYEVTTPLPSDEERFRLLKEEHNI